VSESSLGQRQVTPFRHAHKLRSLVPRAARERLYEWHPTRARRWRRYPGLQGIELDGHAALTFDDGPDDDATPAVLDALDRVGARATFFLLANQLAEHGEIAAEVVRRGHEIGLHGFDHFRHDRSEPERGRDDVIRGFRAIEDSLGVTCRWYRPPYGKMSDGTAEACRSLGLTPVYWSAWGVDWESVTAERIAEVAAEQLGNGGILLLHDSARYGRRPTAGPTAEAIGLIAAETRRSGISLITVGDGVPSIDRMAV
jgi:peptidoglycan/xylan/chitin deacetylase (PgdA/CDA1 family)